MSCTSSTNFFPFRVYSCQLHHELWYCDLSTSMCMKIVSQARQARSTSAPIPYPVISSNRYFHARSRVSCLHQWSKWFRRPPETDPYYPKELRGFSRPRQDFLDDFPTFQFIVGFSLPACTRFDSGWRHFECEYFCFAQGFNPGRYRSAAVRVRAFFRIQNQGHTIEVDLEIGGRWIEVANNATLFRNLVYSSPVLTM
jgi:hypothetical protein